MAQIELISQVGQRARTFGAPSLFQSMALFLGIRPARTRRPVPVEVVTKKLAGPHPRDARGYLSDLDAL